MKNLYSIMDRKSNVYMAPVVAANDDEAIRAFQISLIDSNINEFYLKDLTLFLVAHFDEVTGDVFNLKNDIVMHGDHWSVIEARQNYLKLTTEVANEEVTNNDEIS